MTELALQFGYLGLFLLTVLATTLVAAPSDLTAVTMVTLGYNAVIVGVISVVGGTLGNFINYAVGRYGGEFILSRFFPQDDTEDHWYKRAEAMWNRWGYTALLLSGLPFIGDPITTVAGGLRADLLRFSVIVVFAKIVKFGVMLSAAETFRVWLSG